MTAPHWGSLTVPMTLGLVLAALVYTRGRYRLGPLFRNLISGWRLYFAGSQARLPYSRGTSPPRLSSASARTRGMKPSVPAK